MNAPILFKAKHPVIPPNNRHITQLIISHYHLQLGHTGPKRVLAENCQWIFNPPAASHMGGV